MSDDEYVQCPECGWYAELLFGTDSLGADDGNVFCHQCHAEFAIEANLRDPRDLVV